MAQTGRRVMFSRYTPHAILFGIALIVVMAVEIGNMVWRMVG
jgi:hypothetical protein